MCTNPSPFLVSVHDGGLTFDDAGNPTNCPNYCSSGGIIPTLRCELADAGVVECFTQNPLCTGRRPAGLVESGPARGPLLGAHFAEMARLEAASIDAFRQLRRELIAHGAPRRLVRAAGRAARDEIRHTRVTSALARRHGCAALPPVVERRPVRDVEAIAVENVVEGCVREAFGALVASWQARAASVPVIRAAMARIARDETRHASLAFEVDAWLRRRLDARSRTRVEAARRQALDELATQAADPPIELQGPLGLPKRHQWRRLVQEFGRLAA